MARELQIFVGTCESCKGQKTVTNPNWARAVESGDNRVLGEAMTSGMPREIACSKCRGLGVELSDGALALRGYFRELDKIEAASLEAK
jgi:hypothetical protein